MSIKRGQTGFRGELGAPCRECFELGCMCAFEGATTKLWYKYTMEYYAASLKNEKSIIYTVLGDILSEKTARYRMV